MTRSVGGRLTTLVAVLATLATACSGGSDAAPRPSPTPRKTAVNPPAPTAASSALGPGFAAAFPCQTTFTCATFSVPLDRAHPTTFKLPLQVAVETDRSAPRGVLLLLSGGPGAAAVPTASALLAQLGPEVAAAYRVVLLDQRGTGPTALPCNALQTTVTDDLTPQTAALQECARALGDNRRFYATDDVVADLDDLRAALQVPKLAIFGVSYGTFVAQQYALAHPGRTRALVLDSVVPYDLDDPLQLGVMHAARRVLAAACRAARCPGDPVADLSAVVRRTGEGVALFEAIVATSRTDPTFEDLLPALHDAARGDRTKLDRFLDSYRRAPATAAAIFSNATHASAACRDQIFPWGRSDAPLRTRTAAVRRAAAEASAADYAPFDRAAAVGSSVVRECLPWPPIAPAAIRRPARLPPVPTLMLAGGRDLSTPLEYARAAMTRAPGARLVVLPDAGHIVTAREGKGRAAVRTFLLR
jgi:pimeloyl-ACP methyl ester carboxylesterase